MVQKILQKKRKKDEKETFFGRKRNGNRLYRCVEWGKDPKIKRKRGKTYVYYKERIGKED